MMNRYPSTSTDLDRLIASKAVFDHGGFGRGAYARPPQQVVTPPFKPGMPPHRPIDPSQKGNKEWTQALNYFRSTHGLSLAEYVTRLAANHKTGEIMFRVSEVLSEIRRRFDTTMGVVYTDLYRVTNEVLERYLYPGSENTIINY